MGRERLSENKPTMRSVASKWAIVRHETTLPLCVWRLCELKAAQANVGHVADDSAVTPFDILAWQGQWSLDSEARDIRPVGSCECALCDAARRAAERPSASDEATGST